MIRHSAKMAQSTDQDGRVSKRNDSEDRGLKRCRPREKNIG
jgi:hypothetical protein